MKSITLKLFVLAVLIISPACSKSSQPTKPPDVDYYTCTMHPSVHAEAPGKCPICGMDLVPVMKKTASPSAFEPSSGGGMQGMAGMPGMQSGKQMSGAPSHEFVVPVERQQQIGVTYATVKRATVASYDSRRWNGRTRFAKALGLRRSRGRLRERIVRPLGRTARREGRAADVDLQSGPAHDRARAGHASAHARRSKSERRSRDTGATDLGGRVTPASMECHG